jgi:hypothetical protein
MTNYEPSPLLNYKQKLNNLIKLIDIFILVSFYISLIILIVYQNGVEMDPVFGLIIYNHGSLFGPRIEYIGGDTMEIDDLDADRLCF